MSLDKMAEDVLTKGTLLAWLEGVPDDANIALEINDSLELEFFVTANGQERILRVGVILPDKREQIDPESAP